MTRLSRAALLSCAACSALVSTTLPAAAQSSLGFSQAEAQLGTTATGGDSLLSGRVSADFAITAAHGLQFDIGLDDYSTGLLGTITAHLYMVPAEGQKYGLFGQIADVDGRSATTLSAGAEGIFDLGHDTSLELRGGIGVRTPGSFDFVFVDGTLDRALSDSLGLYAGAMAAAYDEAGFSATGYEARIGARWHIAGTPVVLDASVGRTGLWGDDGRGAETVARLGLSVTLGADGSARAGAKRRMFRATSPLAPLQLRGLE